MVNRTLTIPDLISVTFNLTDLKFEAFSIDPNVELMDLVGDDQLIFAFQNFTGRIMANYMYVTDPPLLADIGQIHFENNSTSFMINGKSSFIDGILNINTLKINLDTDPFILHFDGISDTSDVISRFLTFSGNVIANRLDSMSKF